MVRVWGGRTRPDVDRALGLLSHDERARAERMRSAVARVQFVLSRAALRVLLAGVANDGTGPRDLCFQYGPRGKPYLPGGPSFNVSHSADAVIIAIADKGRVGVDVERVRSVQRMDRVAARKFTPAEHAWFAAAGTGTDADADADLRNAAFFRIWTRKEAFAKALGQGLAAPYRSFSVAPPHPSRQGPGFPDGTELRTNGRSNTSFGAGNRFGVRGGLALLDMPGERADAWTVTNLPWGRDTVAALAVDQPSVVVVQHPLPDAVTGATLQLRRRQQAERSA